MTKFPTAAALAVALLTLALAGCGLFSKPTPEIVLVTPEAEAAHIAPECNDARDPDYKPLPDTALKKSDLAQQDDRNARVISKLKGLRRTCAAGLTALQQQKG